MTLTVRDVLRLDAFSGATVLAGANGLDNKVTMMDIIEVPDVEGWVVPGVLGITAGYAVRESLESQKKLVMDLVNGKAAALVIKVGRFLQKLDSEVLDLADKHNLPVIDMPVNKPFVELTAPVLSEILAHQAVLLQRSAKIHKTLTDVVLSDKGIEAIAQAVAETVGTPCLIESDDFRVLGVAVPSKYSGLSAEDVLETGMAVIFQTSEGKAFLRELNATRRPQLWPGISSANASHLPRVTAPVVVHREVCAYVSVLAVRELEELDFLAVEHASTVVALELVKRRAIEEVKARVQGDVIQDIIFGNFSSTDLLMQRTRAMGWDFERPYVVMAADIDNFERTYLKKPGITEENVQQLKRRLLTGVTEVVRRIDPKAIVTALSDSIVILIHSKEKCPQPEKDWAVAVAEAVKKRASRVAPEVTLSIGIAGKGAVLASIPEAFRQARQALRVGKTVFGGNGVFHYSNLGLYRLLFDVGRQKELVDFYQDTIKPLIDYDVENGTEFGRTLECFLESNGNLAQTAKELYIHRNTLHYRLKRAKEILGMDLSAPEAGLELLMAFKIARILEEQGRWQRWRRSKKEAE